MSDGPVLVAGLERSGTSLMYALLASHSAIAMTRRTNYWRYFADQFGDLADDENLENCLSRMRVYKRLVPLDIDYDRLRSEFVEGPRTYARLYELLHGQLVERKGARRWGDKSLNIEGYAERILHDHPEAQILHMVRDPRDRLASVMTRWQDRRGAVGAGTAAWVWSARRARRFSARHPRNYRIVHYEYLVGDPEGELRDICEFLGEVYEPTMLEMAGASTFRDRGANSSYEPRPAGAINRTSIERFNSVLTSRQIALVESVAGAEMSAHGYQRSPKALTPGERARFNLVDRPRNAGIVAAWRVREAIKSRRPQPLPEYRVVGATP